MKTTLLILSALLILSLIGNYIQFKNARILSDFRTAEHLRFQDALEKSRQRAQIEADSSAAERAKRLKSDSVSRAASKLLAKKDATLTGIAQDQRKAVQPYLDSIHVLAEFVATLDTLLETRLERTGTLESRIENDSISYNKEMAHKDSQNLETLEALRTAVLMADNLQTDLNMAEKKAKKRWGLSAIAGYGVSKDGLTPFIGGGISYDFVKF